MKCPCCGHEWEHKSYTAKLLEALPTTKGTALTIEELGKKLWGPEWYKTRKRKTVSVYLHMARATYKDTWRIFSYGDRRPKHVPGAFPHRFWKEKVNGSNAS